jgi:hypothetical protein
MWERPIGLLTRFGKDEAMIRIDWKDGVLEVRRLVMSRTTPSQLHEEFSRLAVERGLSVADDREEPLAGDLWIGGLPAHGWGAVGPREVGIAPGAEAYLALAHVRHARAEVTDLEPVLARRS